MNRRSFLRHTTHAAAIPAFLGLASYRDLAALMRFTEETDRVLVIIFLQGGNDGLNTVIPLDQLSALNTVRPHVILPEQKLLALEGTELALHPALENFQSLFHEGRLRIIQSVGYPEQNYSHFRSTDIWMSGSDSNELVNSGWAGRFLNRDHPGFPEAYPNEDFTDPLSIEIGYGSSMIFQGISAPMNMVIQDPSQFYNLLDGGVGETPDTLAGDKLKHIRLTARQSQLYGEVVREAAAKGANLADYPENNGLAEQLKIVSRLISGGLKTPLYLVTIGGFDTHDAQVVEWDHTRGEHTDLLTRLDQAVMAFMQDLERHGADDRVLGMTFSEFGRRIVSNASLGTDHGAAAPLFVFGNEVKEGVLGNNPEISPFSTYEDNLPWEYDFRQIYGSVLEQWFGKSQSERDQVLLDRFPTVPILKSTVTDINGFEKPISRQLVRVFPNPLASTSTIQLYSAGTPLQLEVLDLQGRVVDVVFSGILPTGEHQLEWATHRMLPGHYVLQLRTEGIRKAVQVVKGGR